VEAAVDSSLRQNSVSQPLGRDPKVGPFHFGGSPWCCYSFAQKCHAAIDIKSSTAIFVSDVRCLVATNCCYNYYYHCGIVMLARVILDRQCSSKLTVVIPLKNWTSNLKSGLVR